MGTMTIAAHKLLDTTATTAVLTNVLDGLASDYKIARGSESFIGTSGAIATGIGSIVAAVCTLRADPVVADSMWVTCTFAGANLTCKTWRPTAVNDATPLAGANNAVAVDWVAVGT